MKQLIQMDIEQWEKTYKPVLNHLSENPSFDNGDGGVMFETYGPELDYVLTMVRRTSGLLVWTYVDGNTKPVIINGYHLINRIGYFVCQVPWEDQYDIEVSID